MQPRFSSAYKEQTEKDLQDKIAHVVEEIIKKIDSRLFFAPSGVLEKWEMFLESLYKSLNFWFKKGYEPCILSVLHLTGFPKTWL